MITSPKGREMIQHISPIYQKSIIEQAIYEAIGQEWDSAEESAYEVLLQLFPQTATWGLAFWEQRVGLPTNTNEDIEKRRRKVISKMQTRYPINPERMANALQNYTGTNIFITEGVADNTFEVLLKTKTGINGDLQEIIKQINKIKPSHMSYNFIIEYLTEILVKRLYNFWISEPIQACGTIDVSGNPIVATDGWSFKEDIVNIFKRFFSEPFLVCSESTCITISGLSFNATIINTHEAYLSEPMPACSENLCSLGGELIYDI